MNQVIGNPLFVLVVIVVLFYLLQLFINSQTKQESQLIKYIPQGIRRQARQQRARQQQQRRPSRVPQQAAVQQATEQATQAQASTAPAVSDDTEPSGIETGDFASAQ